MLLISLFSWWYGAGWLQLLQRVFARIGVMLDFFSVGLLLKTLFSPYRQISAGSIRGPVGVQLRAWFDRLISRLIGAMVRLAVIAFGLVAMVVVTVVALAVLMLWPLVPVLPVIGVVIAVGGLT